MRGPGQFDPIEIPLNKVLVRLGYAPGKTALDTPMERMVSEGIAEAKQLVNGRQVLASSPVTQEGTSVTRLEPGLTITSTHIFGLLRGCAEAYGFAVTIGRNLEEKRNLLLERKETTRALILDAAGSVAAEELAERTHEQIRQEAAEKGHTATKRFSPGYGDWALATQKDFLRWLGADQIGIQLTGQCQMLPEKSVSAIFGIKGIK